MSKKATLIKHSGLLFNLYFVVFLLLIHKPLLNASYTTMYGDKPTFIFGIIVFTLILFDLLGIIIKVPRIYARATYTEAKETEGAIFPLWLGRTVISVILAFMVFEALGVNTDPEENLVLSIFLIATVIKELFVLIYIAMKSDNALVKNKEKLQKYTFKEFLADAMLWIYITFAYTIAWETIWTQTSFDTYGTGETIVYVLIMIVIFAIVVMPLRMVYLVEEIILIDTNRERIIWGTTTALMAIAAIAKMF